MLLPERPELFPPELLPLPALPLGEVADPEEPPTVPEEPGEPVPTDEPALPEPTEPLPVLLPELPVCAKPAPASAMAATETVAKRSFLMIAFPGGSTITAGRLFRRTRRFANGERAATVPHEIAGCGPPRHGTACGRAS